MQGSGDWGRGSRVEVDWGWRTWCGSGDPREWRVGEGFARLQEWGLKEARAKGFRESCVGFGVAG